MVFEINKSEYLNKYFIIKSYYYYPYLGVEEDDCINFSNNRDIVGKIKDICIDDLDLDGDHILLKIIYEDINDNQEKKLRLPFNNKERIILGDTLSELKDTLRLIKEVNGEN